MKRLIFPLFMVTLLSCSDNVFSYAEKYLDGIVGYTVVNDKKVLKSTDITGIQCDEDERILEAIYYQ